MIESFEKQAYEYLEMLLGYIESQFNQAFQHENKIHRSSRTTDTNVHACL
jgi:septin family protein